MTRARRESLQREWSRLARLVSRLVMTAPDDPRIDRAFARMDRIADLLPSKWGIRGAA